MLLSVSELYWHHLCLEVETTSHQRQVAMPLLLGAEKQLLALWEVLWFMGSAILVVEGDARY